MPKAYGYCRVSTDEQLTSLEVQKDQIQREYDYKHKPNGVDWAGFYVDQGVSAFIAFHNRPNAVRIDAVVEKGDFIIITKMDRGFRNARDFCECLEKWNEAGVHLVLLDLNIDTSTAMGKLAAHIAVAMAEFERNRMSERMKDFFRKRKEKGLGHTDVPHVPYGMKRLRNPGHTKTKYRLVPDEYTRKCAAQFLAWHEQGWTKEKIYYHCLRIKLRTAKWTEWSLTVISKLIEKEAAKQAEEAAKQAEEAAEAAAQAAKNGVDARPPVS